MRSLILTMIKRGMVPFLARKRSTTTVQGQANNRKRVPREHRGRKSRWFTNLKLSKVERA